MRFFPSLVLSSSLIFGLNCASFAKPISKDRIDHVNQFIYATATAQGPLEGWSGGFVSADEDDAGKITRLEFEIGKNKYDRDTKKDGEREGGVKVSIAMSADIEGCVVGDFKYHLKAKDLGEALDDLRKVKDAIEKQGDYALTSSSQLIDGEKFSFSATLTPKSAEAISFKKLHVSFNGDLKTDSNNGELDAVVNAKGELVAKGQTAMTNIFTALSNSKEPAQEDMNNLMSVMEEAMRNMSEVIDVLVKTPTH